MPTWGPSWPHDSPWSGSQIVWKRFIREDVFFFFESLNANMYKRLLPLHVWTQCSLRHVEQLLSSIRYTGHSHLLGNHKRRGRRWSKFRLILHIPKVHQHRRSYREGHRVDVPRRPGEAGANPCGSATEWWRRQTNLHWLQQRRDPRSCRSRTFRGRGRLGIVCGSAFLASLENCAQQSIRLVQMGGPLSLSIHSISLLHSAAPFAGGIGWYIRRNGRCAHRRGSR